MPVVRPESSGSRVIAHIDMDCFYVQVEQRKQPNLRDQPTAVVQYNSWKGGGLIAVGYEARKYGVKRSMRGDEAKKVCPDIQLVQVPVVRDKADLTVYRNAGAEVVSILSKKGCCERASIDEVYLDLTEAAKKMLFESPPERFTSLSDEVLKSHVLGLLLVGANPVDRVREWFLSTDHQDKLLACGAIIVAELRLDVLRETEFTCSAGIAHNKMLAKLASGMNKPAQQTIVPASSVKDLLQSLPIKKMKQLGGKLGSSLQTELGVETVGDLLQFTLGKLQERYGINTGAWLWNIARGVSGEEVKSRHLPLSLGSGKTFPGPLALKSLSSVQDWLQKLSAELNERLHVDLEQNNRRAHLLTLHASAYKPDDSESVRKFPSKSCPLRYGITKIQEDAFNLFNIALREYVGTCCVKKDYEHHKWAVTSLAISASKIVAIPSGTNPIMKYFHSQFQSCAPADKSNDLHCPVDAALPTSYAGPDPGYLEMETFEADTVTVHDVQSLSTGGDETGFSEGGRSEGLTEEMLPSSTSGCQDGNTSSSRPDSVRCGVESETPKRKPAIEKGSSSSSSSILRYFHNHNSCSSSSTFQDAERPQDGTPGAGREAEWRWEGYKSDEIDPDVLEELPLDIQTEVRELIMSSANQHKQNTKKRLRTINHYFPPS